MADYDEDVYGYEEEAEDPEAFLPEDYWTVISSYFDTKGLVSQQIDSFNDFQQTTIQELLDEYSSISVDQNNPPDSTPDRVVAVRRWELKLGNVTISRPVITEAQGQSTPLLPYECRDRNLTYSSPLYVKVDQKRQVCIEERIPLHEMDDDQRDEYHRTHEHPTRLVWETESVDTSNRDKENPDIVFIGKLPVMVKSKACHLSLQTEEDLFLLNECPYDQGGYFIINGSEKVLIAQERSAANIVQVFKKAQPSPFSYTAEIRSALEKGSRLISSLMLKLYTKGDSSKGGYGQTIHTTLPYVKSDLPIAIVFRALGVVSDEDILNQICYDRNDSQMLEMLRPCIEEAFCIQDREVALDYIGKRGNQTTGMTRDRRIRAARDILQKEMLPHISQGEGCETRKAFFLGLHGTQASPMCLGPSRHRRS